MIGDHDVMSKKFPKLSPVTNLLLYIYRVFLNKNSLYKTTKASFANKNKNTSRTCSALNGKLKKNRKCEKLSGFIIKKSV